MNVCKGRRFIGLLLGHGGGGLVIVLGDKIAAFPRPLTGITASTRSDLLF